MRFYIDDNGSWKQVYVEIEPKLSKAFDTTNDSLSVVLRANTVAEPYKPMTAFRTLDDNDVETILWIINDTVDVFSAKPLRYKHTLSIVQYRYFLNKHLIRNTVFNQPRKNKLELFGAFSTQFYSEEIHEEGSQRVDVRVSYRHLVSNPTTNVPNWWGDRLTINSHTKLKSMSYHIDLYAAVNGLIQDADADKWVKINQLSSQNNVRFNDNVYFCIVDLNNNRWMVFQTYIYEFFNSGEIVLDEQEIEEINDYLADHPHAFLQVYVAADNIGASPYAVDAFSFIEPIQSVINEYDSSGNFNPSYFTLTKYRYFTAQIYINIEIYNYTMYDVVSTLLRQYSLPYNDGTEYKRKSLFLLPRGIPQAPTWERNLYNLLTTTYPPDTLSFTQATFYDALTEVFRFYDAGFKFNKDKRLQIEYYNNPEQEITPTLVGVQMSHGEKDFNNGRIAYYQNALLQVKNPRTKIRTQTFGVPNQNDYGILLEKPIYNINKLLVTVYDSDFVPPLSASSEGRNFTNMQLDLTPFIVNDQEYSALDKADPDDFDIGSNLSIRYQSSVLHFARGGNFISTSETYVSKRGVTVLKMDNVLKLATSRYFGYGICLGEAASYQPKKFAHPASQNWNQYIFSIEYQTMNNGRSEIETVNFKYNGEQIVNQNAGIIDINKLGLNMLGESLKDGEPVLTGSCTITKWEDRIREGDYFVDDNNNYWVANVVNYVEITAGKYRCTVEFSKNFNALALRVNSDKEKRLTAISGEHAIMSEDNFIDYVYVFQATESIALVGEEIILNTGALSSLICQTFKDYSHTNIDIRFGMITTYDLENNVNTYGDNETAENIYVPLLKYGLGNCICFEMQYDNATNAGNKLTVSSGWFGTDKYFSSATLYTDDEGWADVFGISFCDLTANGEVNDIGNYPSIDPNVVSYDDSKYVKIVGELNLLEYLKKPNEIFGLNYEWCFLVGSDKQNLFIGNKFINENFFTNKDVIASKTFYLRYVASNEDVQEKYTVLDTKGIGNNTVQITGIAASDSSNTLSIGFKVSRPAGTHYLYTKQWAIVDENNDIYFACNNSATFSDYSSVFQLRFITAKERKDF